jgi:hypothetical protein
MISIPSRVAPAVSRTRLPPTNALERKMRSGTSGATERASIRTNAAIKATAAAIKAIVCSPVQPTSGASETA